MKRNILMLALAMLPVIASACAPPAAPAGVAPAPAPKVKGAPVKAWQVKWDKVLEEARKEREVMIFATLGASTITELTTAFKEKYGIQLNFLAMGSGSEVAERTLRERRTGLYTVDVLIAGATTFVGNVKPAGILDEIEPLLILPEVKDPKAWRNGNPYTDKEKLILPMIASFLRHVTRNTDLVKEGKIKTFRDLLDSKWKGKIILNDPTFAGAGNSWVSLMADRWGEEKTRDYLTELIKQDPAITRDGRIQVESVARGKYALGIATRVEVTNEFMNLGAHIAPVRTEEGGTVTGSGGVLALPTNRPHPSAAAVFINWLLTKEGQAIFIKGFGSPSARLDLPPPRGFNPVLLPEPGEYLQFEDEEALKMKSGPLLVMTQEVFAALKK